MRGAAAPGNETLTRRSLVGSGWSTLSTAGRQFLSLLSVAYLAHVLGPGSYGLMGMAALVTTFVQNFRDLGTASAIVRSPSVSQRMLSSLFWVNAGIGLLSALILFATARPAARFFHEPRLAAILSAMTASFILTAVGVVHNSILAREMEFGRIAIADFGSALAAFLVAIPCAYGGLGVWSLVFANLATSISGTVLYWILCPWRPLRVCDFQEVRSVVRFSLNLSGFGLVNYFGRNADNIIVGRFLGDLQLGYYQMAYNLMLFPLQNITSVMAQVLFPAFSKIQDDNERYRSAYIRSCMLIGLVTFPLLAGLGVVADPFIRVVLGAKWIPAIAVFQILAPVGLIQSVQNTAGPIYLAKGRTDWMFRWSIFSSTVLVLSFYIGIRHGITGVATAYAVAYFVVLLYPGYYIPFRLIELSVAEFTRQLLPQLGITLAMVLGCMLWMRGLDMVNVVNPLPRLVSTVLLGISLYVGLLIALRPTVMDHVEDMLKHVNPALYNRTIRVTRIFVERPLS